MSETMRRQVEAMAAYGIPEKEIARVIGIGEAELQLDYAEELATGATKANSRVAENLYRKAVGDGREAVTAAIFWLKTRAGWRETHVVESDVRFVIEMPGPPSATVEEWLERHRPRIEDATTGGTS